MATLFGAPLLINKQVLFDFITLSRAWCGGELRIHNEYLCLEMRMWHRMLQSGKLQQLSTDAPVAQNSNSWSYWGCRWAEGAWWGGGVGERGRQPQSEAACCVAFNFINTFIILCHTAESQWHKWRLHPTNCLLSYSPLLPLPRLFRRQSVCHSGRFG